MHNSLDVINKVDRSIFNRKQINKILLTILFLIYPLGALPFILRGIYDRDKYCYFLFSIFWGMTGMLYAPNGDLFRYYNDYFIYEGLSFSSFSLYLLVQAKIDVGLPYMQWLFSQVGLTNDLIVFLFIGIGTQFLLQIFYYETIPYANYKKTCFTVFLIVFLSISLWGFYFRYGFASMMLVYGVYTVLRKNRNGWIWIMIAPIFHFSMIIFAIIFFIVNLFKISIKRSWFLIAAILSFIFSGDLLSDILLNLNVSPVLQSKIIEYTEGYWASEFINDRSIGARIVNSVSYVSKFIIFFIIYKSWKNTKIYDLLTIILIAIVLFAPFVTIKMRFEWTFNILSMVVVIPALLNKNLKFRIRKKLILSLCIIGVFTTISGLVFKRFILPQSDERILLYSSAPKILAHKYTFDWLTAHSDLGE